MTKALSRQYSDAFPSTNAKRVTFTIDKIPPALWPRVQAKAKRDGVSMRALLLQWCDDWTRQPKARKAAKR